jgi:adenosine deaminase
MELGNANGRQLLTDPGCLRRQCELLYQHFREQNLLFAEVRCSPNNYTSGGRSAWQVLTEIRTAFQQCMDKDPGCQVNLLIIATRKDGGDRSDISRHLALAITAAQHWTSGCRVTGVDLAGFEHKDTRAALFATDFEPAHRVGLAVSVHAGENDDAEGIWQAVFRLNARRLGHALHLVDAPDLQRAVADRGIAVELCPCANYQIKGFHPMPGQSRNYPLKDYLKAGIPVTINTDNIGISAASLTENFLLAARLCPGLTRWDVLRLLAHAVQAAFLSPSERSQLRGRIQEHLHPPR